MSTTPPLDDKVSGDDKQHTHELVEDASTGYGTTDPDADVHYGAKWATALNASHWSR
jgi:hypothetical protein